MNLINSIIRWLSEVFSTPGRAIGVLVYFGTFIALVVAGWLVLTFLISQFWE
jgi:predicted PurR-regulated permease PerM